MALRQTLPRAQWNPFHFWHLNKQNKQKRENIYPIELMLLWSYLNYTESLVGPAPTYTDTPTVDADGVTPGDGPAFTSVVTWADGGTRVWEITMTTASADLVGDVEVGGGLSVNSSGLKFSDGTNTATVAASWAAGEVVTAVVQTEGAEMRVSDGVTYSAWMDFDGTMPGMAFASTAPGSLLRVEEWKKVTPRPGQLLFDGEALAWNGDTIFWEGI